MSQDLIKTLFIGLDGIKCEGIIEFIEHCVEKEVARVLKAKESNNES